MMILCECLALSSFLVWLRDHLNDCILIKSIKIEWEERKKCVYSIHFTLLLSAALNADAIEAEFNRWNVFNFNVWALVRVNRLHKWHKAIGMNVPQMTGLNYKNAIIIDSKERKREYNSFQRLNK